MKMNLTNGVFSVVFKEGGKEYRYLPNSQVTDLKIEEIGKRVMETGDIQWLKNVTICLDSVKVERRTQLIPVETVMIKSFTDPDKEYAVTKYADGSMQCKCPHHQIRGAFCKHMREVAGK